MIEKNLPEKYYLPPIKNRKEFVTFYPSSLIPNADSGYLVEVIVRFKSTHNPNFLVTTSAYYLNEMPLYYHDGCGAENCENDHQDGCPATGWFSSTSNFEFDECFERLQGDIIEWSYLPKAEKCK